MQCSTVTDSDAWSSFPRPVKPLELPAIQKDFKPHTQLLNMCMDALNQILSKRSANYDNEITNHGYNRPLRKPSREKVIPRVPNQIGTLQQSQVLIGYAVPFLFIPGIVINSPNMRFEFQFSFAFSGEEAIGYLEGHASEVVMILSDINMPGMSGIELLKSIRNMELLIIRTS